MHGESGGPADFDPSSQGSPHMNEREIVEAEHEAFKEWWYNNDHMFQGPAERERIAFAAGFRAALTRCANDLEALL